jgi:hypothetical protein
MTQSRPFHTLWQVDCTDFGLLTNLKPSQPNLQILK